MNSAWNFYINYKGYNYVFFGTFLRESMECYAFCDNAELASCGRDTTGALSAMKSYALDYLEKLEYNGELEQAVVDGRIIRNNDNLLEVNVGFST